MGPVHFNAKRSVHINFSLFFFLFTSKQRQYLYFVILHRASQRKYRGSGIGPWGLLWHTQVVFLHFSQNIFLFLGFCISIYKQRQYGGSRIGCWGPLQYIQVVFVYFSQNVFLFLGFYIFIYKQRQYGGSRIGPWGPLQRIAADALRTPLNQTFLQNTTCILIKQKTSTTTTTTCVLKYFPTTLFLKTSAERAENHHAVQ